MTQVFLITGATSPWSRPGGWTDANNWIELVGHGGYTPDPGVGTALQGTGGGGGGAYQKRINLTIAATTPFRIGTGAVTNTTRWGNDGTTGANYFGAAAGVNSTETTSASVLMGSGAGGSATQETGGTPPGSSPTGFKGGDGGGCMQTAGGGGGGGAGSPLGPGGNGGNAPNVFTADAGGGGGGAGGGGDGQAPTVSGTGGVGGTGPTGTAGGAGGVGANPGVAGTNGSGGGGGGGSNTGWPTHGSDGSAYQVPAWPTGATSGSGAGGGGMSNATGSAGAYGGGFGGLYGGGAGGVGGQRGSGTYDYKWPADGLIVISYNITTDQALTQSARYTNTNTFPTGVLTGPPQALTQSARFDDSDTFYTAGVAIVTPLTQSARFNDADSFPAATLSTTVGLTESARFNDADSFPAATLSTTVALSQSARFDDADSFPQATLTTTVALTQSARFDDPDTFYTGTLSPGAVALVQSARFDDADTFYTGVVSQGGGDQALTQSARFDDADNFPQAILSASYSLTQSARFTDPDSFPAAQLSASYSLTQAARFDDADTFYTGTIAQAGAPQALTQSARLDDADSFPTGLIAVTQSLSASARFDNANAFRFPDAARSVDANTKLLLHCDGADGSISFVDEAGHTVTAYSGGGTGGGGATNTMAMDTAQSVFGGASANFVDANGDWLTVPGTDFALGTGDYVVDFRMRLADTASRTTELIDFRGLGEVTSANLSIQLFGTFIFLHLGGGGDPISYSPLNADQWYHVALIRSSSGTRLFIDGVQVGSTYTDTANYAAPSEVVIGGQYPSGIRGWLDEVRVSIGTDRGWYSGFTPPAEAYSGDSGAILSHELPQWARLDDPDSFFGATLLQDQGLTQSIRLDDADGFFSATLLQDQALTQSARLDDADDFFAGIIGVEGGDQFLAGTRFDDPDEFFTGTIALEEEEELPAQLPGGSSRGAYPRQRVRVRIIDPNERRRIIEQDDRVVLSMVQEFLDAINRDQPWHP